MVILIVFFLHWFGSLFFQTFFLHRYASHKMFTMNKFWERVFYLLTYVAQGSSYLVPRAYAVLHRMHHSYSDTKEDPHSPNFFKDVFSMMWHTKKIYQGIANNTLDISTKFLGNYPTWIS
jgi:stearoyl-CoA desaturase (delta-9 desaturase)